VRGLCRGWGVALHEGRAAAPLRGEAAAREARYAFLRRVRELTGATHLATAHHADDQAETVLFRVLRGTGIDGLAGIPAADGDGTVRPLLGFTRDEVGRYARRAGLRWREDPTNALADAARNRIRLELLPRIERTVAPGARRALARLASLAAEDGRRGRPCSAPWRRRRRARRTGRSCLSANALRLMMHPSPRVCCARCWAGWAPGPTAREPAWRLSLSPVPPADGNSGWPAGCGS
jgi:tRNA(Ile)-lysidine synthase TilS/MesJ